MPWAPDVTLQYTRSFLYFKFLRVPKKGVINKTAAAALPASYLISGRRASVGNEVTEYAK